MKDKRILLKLSGYFGIIYSVTMILYYSFFKKINYDAISNIFVSIINIIFSIVLINNSSKNINEIKKNKVSIIVSSIWLLITSILPGILGFIFLAKISDKSKTSLPEIKEPLDNNKFIKSLIFIVIFITTMSIMSLYKSSSNIPIYLVYLLLFILTILFNYKYLKNDFLIFIKNIKIYIPFIIKRYFIMLTVMLIVSIPIVLINNGEVSSNQKLLNEMFVTFPIITFILSTLYAPLVEESVFRLSLFKVLKNEKLFIIISTILFGSLHMLDKFTSIKDLLYILQYSALGLCLAKAYVDSKNIFVSISMHFIQNFIAAILVLLMFTVGG